MAANILKSTLHNIGVVAVGFVFALISRGVDLLFGFHNFISLGAAIAGWLLLIIGFLIRVWATYYFYEDHMKVIVLVPQEKLITSGPYRYSRNPLYLGGNLFIFLGAVFIFGSPSGIVLTAIELIFTDIMIRREEKQLALKFGAEWTHYKSRVRRWL